MAAPARIGLLSQFEIGQWYHRWAFYVGSLSRNQEQCQLCGAWIRSTHMGGNGLAQSSHLRTHVRAGVLLEKRGKYKALIAMTPPQSPVIPHSVSLELSPENA